jgi:hypothetical protein
MVPTVLKYSTLLFKSSFTYIEDGEDTKFVDKIDKMEEKTKIKINTH